MISLKLEKDNIKIVLIAITFIILALLLPEKYAMAHVLNNTEEQQGKKTILIDPGHGGIDGGAESKNGTIEKDINLKISLELKKVLLRNKFNVIMTREEDKGLYTENGTIRKKKIEDLNNRCKMKEESGCDLFISIHQNLFPQSQYYGAQIWYSKNEESKRLAHIIQESLKMDFKDNNKREEKPALDAYKILRSGKDVPSVIVECGFLSNPSEERKLKDETYQKQLAESIGKAIVEFYSQ